MLVRDVIFLSFCFFPALGIELRALYFLSRYSFFFLSFFFFFPYWGLS
jgi:hypothetical protein